MSHTHTNLLFHIVFSTKERVPMLDANLKPRLFAYMGGIIRELGGTALLTNGSADHVHILASLPAKLAVSEVVGKVKANTSGWVHREFSDRRSFGWQTGFAAFTVSHSQKRSVLEYSESGRTPSQGFVPGRVSLVPQKARNRIRRKIFMGMNAGHLGRFLSPLTGLASFRFVDPRLTPWAAICRCSAATA